MSNRLELSIAGKYMCWHVGGEQYKLVAYGRWGQRVNRYLDSPYAIRHISVDSEPVFRLTSQQLEQVLKTVFNDRRF